jgi:hypothetical protein
MNRKKRREAYRKECESNGGDCYFCKYQNTCPKSEYTPKEDEDREYMEDSIGDGREL